MQSFTVFITILLFETITVSSIDKENELIVDSVSDKIETAQRRLLELQTKLNELRQQLQHVETDRNAAPNFKHNVEQPKATSSTTEKPSKLAPIDKTERKFKRRQKQEPKKKKVESSEEEIAETLENLRRMLAEGHMENAQKWLGGDVRKMNHEDLRKKIAGLLWYVMWGVNDHINDALDLLREKAIESAVLAKTIDYAEELILKATYDETHGRGTAAYTKSCLQLIESIRQQHQKVVSMGDDVDTELTSTNRVIDMIQAAWNIITTDAPVAFRRDFLQAEDEEATKQMITETRETILEIMAEDSVIGLQELEMLVLSLSEIQSEWLLSRELEKRKQVPFRSYVDRQYRMRYFLDDPVYWDAAEKVCRDLNGSLLGLKTPAKRLAEAVQKELQARMQEDEKIWVAKEGLEEEDWNDECYVFTRNGMQLESSCIERQHGFACWKAAEVEF